MCPALPSDPFSRRPSSTMPPPTPVDTTIARKFRSPAAAPAHPSPSASALAPMSTARATSAAIPPNLAPMSRQQPADQYASFASTFSAIVENVERVIQGKLEVIQLAALCLLSEGHLLIEDVPGVGKTSLAKSL